MNGVIKNTLGLKVRNNELKIKEALEIAYEHGRNDRDKENAAKEVCDGCSYKEHNLEEYPCNKCRRIAFDYYKAREA